MRVLSTEFIQVVPGSRDREGRQVILVDAGKFDKTIDKAERVRAAWCVLLAALEDVETQRKGICFLMCLKDAKLKQFDIRFDHMMAASIQGALPIRVGSVNVSFPPPVFRFVWAVVKQFVKKKVQDRVYVIPGSSTLERLQERIAVDDIPEPMGPKRLDFADWLAQRVETEAAAAG